jgi:hypothetical protein
LGFGEEMTQTLKKKRLGFKVMSLKTQIAFCSHPRRWTVERALASQCIWGLFCSLYGHVVWAAPGISWAFVSPDPPSGKWKWPPCWRTLGRRERVQKVQALCKQWQARLVLNSCSEIVLAAKFFKKNPFEKAMAFWTR